jgi:hypothetical protein
MRTTTLVTVALAAILHSATALAQKCDPSIPGNSTIANPSNCLVRKAERDGIVISLPASSKHGVDPAKVPACTAIGAQLMRRMGVTQEDYIANVAFSSTFTFSSRCARISLECQVLETGNQPILNKPPWGSVSMQCGESADRYTDALRIIVPGVPAGKVTPFVARCLAATKAGKQEGPVDAEIGTSLLICDPQHPDGPNVTIEPRT